LADSFDPDCSGDIHTILLQPDGKIVVGGVFGWIGGQQRSCIARLDPVTGLADSFDPNASQGVYCLALQTDGKIIVSGLFNGPFSIGGQTRNYIARLDPVTGAVDSFDPNANEFVLLLVPQPDGKILAGGTFQTIGGQPRNHIARLDPVTGAADSFNPNANADAIISAITPEGDGKIVVSGNFVTIGGLPRNNVARLDSTTGLADPFDPHPDGSVDSISLSQDGKILAGGGFGNIGGQPRMRFARLSNNSAVQQNLSVTPSTVTWTRAGPVPRFERVTFELSSDNVNYTSLGNGTAAAANNWSLSGLSLPLGQNIYVRGRGYYRTGWRNNGVSVMESVRNAFLFAPLQLSTAVSRKRHGAAGAFDIDLLNANFGPECRSSGGAHTVVITFNNNIVSGNANVTAGTGTVSGSPTFSANAMTVNLAGVADVQKITLTLSDVTDSFSQVLPTTTVSMNLLVGDINGSKAVTASDVGEVKARAGSAIDATTFRSDVALNGTINATDIGLVKSRSGQIVP
jgi:hypothetical protein